MAECLKDYLLSSTQKWSIACHPTHMQTRHTRTPTTKASETATNTI